MDIAQGHPVICTSWLLVFLICEWFPLRWFVRCILDSDILTFLQTKWSCRKGNLQVRPMQHSRSAISIQKVNPVNELKMYTSTDFEIPERTRSKGSSLSVSSLSTTNDPDSLYCQTPLTLLLFFSLPSVPSWLNRGDGWVRDRLIVSTTEIKRGIFVVQLCKDVVDLGGGLDDFEGVVGVAEGSVCKIRYLWGLSWLISPHYLTRTVKGSDCWEGRKRERRWTYKQEICCKLHIVVYTTSAGNTHLMSRLRRRSHGRSGTSHCVWYRFVWSGREL